MNSNYMKNGTSSSSSSSINNLDFDLGFGSTRPRSLNEQKNRPINSSSSHTSSFPISNSKPMNTNSQTWQPSKPSWTHQPAPVQSGVTRTELGGPTSMVGDIFGKSWGSMATGSATGGGTGVGVVNKNPNLFGDLVSSALGQGKSGGNSNAPLKSAPPKKDPFSMRGVGDTLPKTGYGGGSSWGSSQNVSGLGGVNKGSNVGGGVRNVGVGGSGGIGVGGGMSVNKDPFSSLGGGGSSMRNVGVGGSGGIGVGGGMSVNKDPFSSLGGFETKPMGGIGSGSGGGSGTSLNSSNKAGIGSGRTDDFAFGDFQNASKSNASTFSFGNSKSMGSSSGSVPKMDSFMPQNKPPVQSSTANVDSFDMFSSFSTAGVTASAASNDGFGRGQQFSGGDDWGMDSEFGGGNDGGNTTELDGLPPPPAGVSGSSAKTKGLDNYKQGQYADAIKWLSWAEVLLEKSGDNAGTMEVLICRASCYKEVGEYKKAVADCTKVLGQDDTNVAVLVQRALLYESMEKYRLGADDLQTVMKLDPGNRVARSTIHRLNKLAD